MALRSRIRQATTANPRMSRLARRAARAGLPAFWITKTPEAACVEATVSEWPSRPDGAAVAAITEHFLGMVHDHLTIGAS